MAGLTAVPAPLRILADDLTGALDSAAAFGAGVPVYLGEPPAVGANDSGDAGAAVEVLATATRDVPPAQLPALLGPAVAWLAGAGRAFKKVDSLLRGNTFDEVDHVARAGGFDRVLFAPAFPQQQRRTRAGWQRVGAADETVGTESIVAAMQRRGWQASVEAPGGHAGPAVWVPDVQDDADLRRLVAQVEAMADGPGSGRCGRWLWVGSAGLAQALGGDPALHADVAHGAASTEAPTERRTWLVSASHHPVSRRQWSLLAEALPTAPSVRGGELPALERLLAQLCDGGAAPGPVLLDLAPDAPMNAADATALLARQLHVVASQALRPQTLVVVGGDTLLALCRATGARSLRSVSAWSRPGWGCATLQGGGWHGTRCHTRSGAFGGPADLCEVLQAVGALS